MSYEAYRVARRRRPLCWVVGHQWEHYANVEGGALRTCRRCSLTRHFAGEWGTPGDTEASLARTRAKLAEEIHGQ